MTAPLQVLLAGFDPIVHAFTAWAVKASKGGLSQAQARLLFNPDGSVTKGILAGTNAGTDGTANWYFPTTAGVGSLYWIRFTVTSGSANDNSGTLGTWLPLSSAQFVGNLSATPVSATVTADISANSAGTAIVATYTGNTVATVA